MENRCPSPQLVYEYILKVRGTHKRSGYPQTQAYPSLAFLQYVLCYRGKCTTGFSSNCVHALLNCDQCSCTKHSKIKMVSDVLYFESTSLNKSPLSTRHPYESEVIFLGSNKVSLQIIIIFNGAFNKSFYSI